MLISHDMIRMQILHVGGDEGILRSQPLMISLLQYGRMHCEITILEGILPSEDYKGLFETAVVEYGPAIFAYYYDLPFEETLRRHSTKPNCGDFGESEMRRWWREKDFLPMIHETVLTQDVRFEDTVDLIYRQVKDCIHPV